MNSTRFISRMWFYFRIGYGQYLTFVLGYVSTLITVYYLAIKNIPSLLTIFPNFAPFAVLSTAIGAPTAVGVGWIHLKRSALYSSEIDIGVESNPYTSKLPAFGVWRDAQYPSELLRMRLIYKMADKSGLLTPADKLEMAKLERNYILLLEGKHIGTKRWG